MYRNRKYEYTVEVVPGEDVNSYVDSLNYMGGMGWELVYAEATDDNQLICTFKRLLIEETLCAN